ncbi:MAG: LuxR C-terminal-related transcriptional regulator [Calditrichia bacterium]
MIDVFITDSQKIVRDGLKELLGKTDTIRIVGEAKNGNRLFERVQETRPKIVLLDMMLSGVDCNNITREMVAKMNTRVIALANAATLGDIKAMLSAGAKGFMLKDSVFEELLSAVDMVWRNHLYLSTYIAGMLISKDAGKSRVDLKSHLDLSPREIEVLRLLVEGNSTREIAVQLFVSIKTVETHRGRIKQKLEIDTIAGLTKYAIREGLTSLDF